MKPFADMPHHPTSEQLVAVLCQKTQTDNPLFFRVLVAYYFSVIASMMRTTIVTADRGDIPVNMYALNLSPSGTGKGFSTNIMENHVINQFRQRFLEETFPMLAEQNLPKLANKRANRKQSDPDDELLRVQKEFDELGSLLFSFSEATSPAIKQMRHKLLMADAGALNLQVDEIGSNLLSNMEAFNTYLELYDVGAIKQKLVKNTAESKRGEEIIGKTPTNLMLFGTPVKLLNGGKVEEELYSLLETGYARRCFFGYIRAANKIHDTRSAAEVFEALASQQSNKLLDDLSRQLEHLADITNVGKKLVMPRDVSIELIEYRLACEAEAAQLPEHEEIRKAEISHRYFKALKLAGAYAFVDDSPEVTSAHVEYAIKLAEESGEAFTQLLTRDRPYVKLARYIASVGKDITQADLTEDLPFYRGAAGQKQEMLTLAIAWGYKNNVIIKKSFSDGIEFLRGETLKATDITKMVLSASDDLAYNYENGFTAFDELHNIVTAPGIHWCAHHLNNGHRTEDNCIPGFNLVVLDVENSVNLSTAKMLLQNYKYLIYTTKRHTEDEHRYRIVLPTNFTLTMDSKDYKEFMQAIYEWLPFEVDTATGQRARKWMAHDGHFEYNDGELFDVLPFIPKTSKNEERKNRLESQQQMDNLERWVINNTGDGNRNNMILRYGMILVDAGFDIENVRKKIMELNDKMADKLEEAEIMSTIMVSVIKAHAKKHP